MESVSKLRNLCGFNGSASCLCPSSEVQQRTLSFQVAERFPTRDSLTAPVVPWNGLRRTVTTQTSGRNEETENLPSYPVSVNHCTHHECTTPSVLVKDRASTKAWNSTAQTETGRFGFTAVIGGSEGGPFLQNGGCRRYLKVTAAAACRPNFVS
jgi:hypothetical protein